MDETAITSRALQVVRGGSAEPYSCEVGADPGRRDLLMEAETGNLVSLWGIESGRTLGRVAWTLFVFERNVTYSIWRGPWHSRSLPTCNARNGFLG